MLSVGMLLLVYSYDYLIGFYHPMEGFVISRHNCVDKEDRKHERMFMSLFGDVKSRRVGNEEFTGLLKKHYKQELIRLYQTL